MGTPAWDDLSPAPAASGGAPKWDDLAPAATGKPAEAAPSDGSTKFGGILGWLQAADRLSERGSHRLVAGIDRFGQGVAQNIGLPDSIGNYLRDDAVANEQRAEAPVPGAVQWADVKANPGIGNIASYIGQSAIGASPDIAAAVVNPLLYAASREGDVAHTRAVNNGHGDNIGLTDMALAAPTATADALLMKYGLGGILAKEGQGIIAGTLRAAGRDAIMGGGQPTMDYLGERVGTNANIDPREMADNAVAGMVAMAPFGAAAHLGSRAVNGIRGTGAEPGPSPEAPVAVRDQLTPEQADALTLHGIDVDTLEDANMARKAADRLLARQPAPSDAPAVIATKHGNIAPNADAQGRAPETRSINGGDERAKFERAVGGAENATGDPNAKNPNSSASGNFQFTDDTFVRQYQRRFGTGESRESILAKKNDPRLQSVLMKDLTNANEDVLRRSGVPLTAGNYYLAHFAGAGGAVKLNRNLDAPVERILGQKAVDANPFLAGMTGRDVVNWASSKMHEGPAVAGHAVDYPARPSDAADGSMFRAPDHSEADTGAYGFDPIDRPQRPTVDGGAHDTGTMGEFENTKARVSKTAEEMNQPGSQGSGMATDGMGRPFKADPNAAEFEQTARDNAAKAQADVEKRFEARRAEAERMKAEFDAKRKTNSGQNDASGKYQSFGSKPHYDPDAGHFRTTDDGYVADEAGNPVVWPSQGAAAKWAARFKMGGDFELQAHGATKRGADQPVTLQRKPNSTYGQTRAPEGEPARPGEAPQIAAPKWEELEPAGHGQPDVGEGGDKSAGAEVQRNLPPEDKFPGDYSPEEAGAARAKRIFDDSHPGDPGKEPPRPASFFTDVANHLAARSKKAGMAVRINAEDAISHGVAAESIYHNPGDKFPTVKANAAKVFTSSKAPLKSRAKPVKMISLDDLGDRFDPRHYGVPGDEIHGSRLAPEHAGELLRKSIENDPTARNQADPRFDAHKAWTERMDALMEFEAKYGDDWAKLTDDQLAELDPGAFDAFYDDVLQGAKRPEVDPFDPAFWENEGDGEAHPGETGEPGVQAGGRDNLGASERDPGQPGERSHGAEDGGFHASQDFFGERPGDQRQALERKGDEPLRGKKAQKAPGSDGGLFDDHGNGDRQGTLLHGHEPDAYNYDVFRDLPRAKLPDGLIKNGMDADRALNWIAENSHDEFHRQLGDLLVDLTAGVKIETYDRSQPMHAEYGDSLRGAHGAVIHKGGQARIFLNESKYGHGHTEETLLHEAIHAAIATRVGALRKVSGADVDAARGFGQDVRRIKVLQQHVAREIQRLDRSGQFREKNYAYETMKAAHIASENVDEFLTYAMTDKEFQRLLSDIKVPDTFGETGRLTAWQKFVNLARRVVGLDAKYQAPFEKLLDADNAFHSAIDTFNAHAERLAETTPHEQSDAQFNANHDGGILLHEDRRHGEDRREFGRKEERRQVRATDVGTETHADRAERQRQFNEDMRVNTRTSRALATAKRLLSDDRGSLDLDAVAKFFVDTDALRDTKEGFKNLAAALRTTSARDILTKTLDVASDTGRGPASYLYSMDARMRGLARRFNSPTITKLADMFHARAGHDDGTGRTYHAAVRFHSIRWNRQLFETLHPFAKDAGAMERIRNIITNTGTGSVEEKAAAATVSKLLKEIHDYRRDAGEDLGEVQDYFPRILNPDAVVKDMAGFKTEAEKLFQMTGHSAHDAKAMADVWFHQVVNEHAGLDGSILDTRRAKAPGTTSGLARKLPKDADKILARFYTKDPLDVLQAYITGSAKRAEFTRRFGVPGREGSPERAAWIAQHGQKDQLDVMRKGIDNEILASGRDPGDAQQLLNDLLEANLGILGKSGTKFRLAVSLAHGYNQIAKMDHSLFTSLTELSMGFVRGTPAQGMKYLATTVKEFGRELLHMPPSEARRYAEHLGLVLNPLMDQVLQSRISAVEGTRGVNKVVSRFYKVIGLHQFTEAERIAAAQMAREHLNALAGDLGSSNARTARRAERALAELGITDHKAFAQFINQRSGKVRFGEIDGDKGMASQWSTAVARMTDQTVMEPTRAVKPLWANHPLGSLIYGLMSYSFAFKKNVLDRAGQQAIRGVKERDIALLTPLLFGLPILAGMTYLNDTYVRPALFGSTYDFKHEATPMAVIRTMDRASIDGGLSPFVNAMFGTKYTRSLAEAALGSVAGSVAQGAENIVVKPMQAKVNGTKGNAAARGQAGAIYDLFLEPAIDAAATAGVGGKVATGVVYASGSREGSIFPSDREAFISAMAGEKDNGSGGGDPFKAGSSSKDPFGSGGKDPFSDAFSKKGPFDK